MMWCRSGPITYCFALLTVPANTSSRFKSVLRVSYQPNPQTYPQLTGFSRVKWRLKTNLRLFKIYF